jgi:hypothetical protein
VENIMDQVSLASLVAELFAAIHLMSGYPLPAEPPVIHFVPQAQLAEMVCQRPCRVRAVYFRDSGVYVDETLDLLGEDLDRSILLHELVHHVQAVTGRYDSLASECRRWTASEREAYSLQSRYLRHINSPSRVAQPPESRRC